MKLQDKLLECQQNRKALLACNFYNFETLKSIMLAAQASKKPVILQLTKSSIDYLGLPIAVKMARSALDLYGVQAWIHLDHSHSINLIKRVLDAGFDSVMIDASEKTFGENIKITQEVVKIAESYEANVEAELGFIAKLGQDQSGGLTNSEEAKIFVEDTGVNALAVAIGTAHGFYKKPPQIDMQRLSEIKEATQAFLVLHGSSGIPHIQLSEAVSRGICKINLATEIKNNFIKSLSSRLLNNNEIDLRKVFPHATNSTASLIEDKLNCINS
ncbi:class II fructose-bisphosphate aldolase [Membranihabitans maritimus]|uniref:class II fructose-bisphosphate aldolase n=1 Tax=Membranihabitans maritimus TaxID=2904244 RepID=UPI001F2AFB5E|nr:class II fructose-bisphosphate aldolase [Membranihabitans maritimus]